MGDYRIIVEASGGHGCGREAKDGEAVKRCGSPGCPDCRATDFVAALKASGNSVTIAKLEHWPHLNLDKSERRPVDQAGPVDDLLTGVRRGSFVK